MRTLHDVTSRSTILPGPFALRAGRRVTLWGILGVAVMAATGHGADDVPGAVQAAVPAADAAAIRAAASAYRTALTKRDAAAIRDAWVADGDVVDGWGNRLSLADIAVVGGETPADMRPEFRVGESRLRLIAADVVVEDGTADVVMPGTSVPLEGWFSAIWVRRGGAWKLACVRESERPIASQADALDDLDWMVGDWVLVAGDDAGTSAAPAMEMSVRWDSGRTFLVREARLTSAGAGADSPEVEVQQRIGWDPLVNRIRSWSFSTDGSRSEATWFRDGDSWIARGAAVLPDGTQTTAVNIYTYDGKDRWVWRTMPEPTASNDGLPTRALWIRKPGNGAK
jgi:hypothetical protein